ncbi:MAG: DUF4293 family protein [Bacteroidia bacterium]|nr:DUF4293 family protein [Bacteroidia bacterium]MDW8159477.1 DUF4293 family protein [Bacteroidia bacterium]
MSQIRFFEDPEFFRRQTLFTTFALLCTLLTIFSPIFQLQATGKVILEISGWTASGSLEPLAPKSNWLFLQTIFLFIALVIIAAVVFNYKQRKRQIMLCRLSISSLLMAPTMGYAAALSYADFDKLGVASIYPSYGVAFPIVAIVCLLYAEKLIRSDIHKLRSMSRFW